MRRLLVTFWVWFVSMSVKRNSGRVAYVTVSVLVLALSAVAYPAADPRTADPETLAAIAVSSIWVGGRRGSR